MPLASEAAAALVQVITQRHLKSSTVLTTNLGIASWGSHRARAETLRQAVKETRTT